MTAGPKWGRAGERLHPDGSHDDRRFREVRAERGRARLARLADDREAYRRWRAGLVCPHRITMALDMHDLHGPDVDIACKAAEPEVDQWEAGERYPSWAQLVALAELTGMTARWFTVNDFETIPIWRTSLWFHMSAAERKAHEKAPPPIMRYPRAVLDERPPSPPELPEPPDGPR